MDTVDRIFELVDDQYKDQKDFAAELGVTDKTVSAWRTRRVKSYVKYLSKIAVVLGTTTDYLVSGEGPKRRDQIVGAVDVSHSMASPRGTVYDLSPKKAAVDMVDRDVAELLQQLKDRPEMRMLFHVTRGATRDQIMAIVKMVESLQGDGK